MPCPSLSPEHVILSRGIPLGKGSLFVWHLVEILNAEIAKIIFVNGNLLFNNCLGFSNRDYLIVRLLVMTSKSQNRVGANAVSNSFFV
jgi:hypothetical protein